VNGAVSEQADAHCVPVQEQPHIYSFLINDFEEASNFCSNSIKDCDSSYLILLLETAK
jgi:hypothetical protein